VRLLTGISRLSAALLFCIAPAVLRADCTTTGSGASAVTVCVSVSTSSNNLTANQVATLTALVTVTGTGTSNANLTVTWSASPAVSGAVLPEVGTASGGTTTNTYTAPATIASQQTVTITATAGYNQTTAGTTTITLSPGSTLDVGTGAPAALVQQFFSAFYRNGFNNLVSLPPLGQVKALGTTGYVQEFDDAAKDAGVKYALATASTTALNTSGLAVVQIFGGIYAYYTSIGAATAGYPLTDTQTCPAIPNGNTCTYQFFDKSYVLVVYSTALASGADFSISGAIYTEWYAQGGIPGAGLPVSAAATITASTATTASAQSFSSGAVYSITSGVNKGKTFSVLEPVYDFYNAQNGPAGSLGLPASEMLIYQSGLHVQLFEHGSVQYMPGAGPTLQVPVAAVAISGTSGAASTTLNLGQSLTLTASPEDANGNLLTTPISWSSSNGQAISIQANAQGQTAVITAVGAGSANVTASSGGITSAKLSFTVVAPCCQVGDGAPAAVQQAFETALARNNITVQLPLPQPAVQVGNGYTQAIPANGGTPALLLAEAGQAGSAYVIAGALLAQYEALGGPAGMLGYPLSDASAAGTQLFAGGALGGNPVRLVTGQILAKWAALGYDAGAAGSPAGDAAAFTTLGGNSGTSQAFTGGTIYGATVGPRAGQTYFVSGLILTAFIANGGPAGNFGMPTGDEVDSPALRQQNFEGGTISYVPGASVAQAQLAPKTPAVVVAPATIAAGGQARLAVSGFANNSAITVAVTGEPNFTVTTANGAYSWDMFVPLTAASGTVTIQASGSGGASAAGTLTIQGYANNRLQLAKVQGDLQTGAPGALLPVALQVALLDASGAPVMGAPVVFQGVPGLQLSVTSAVTDSNGMASTQARLPLAAGTALVTANSPSFASAPVTFALLAQASSLASFPNLQEAGAAQLGNGASTIGQKGALLTAVASILLYHQNRGDVPAPNGAASAGALNQFLTGFCITGAGGNPLCDGFLANPNSGEQVVNLWRAAQFTGGLNVTGVAPTLASVADLVAQGEPVLLSLALTSNGAAAGGNFVVATGIGADGSIAIADPNPFFGRANLNDYLNGFSGWKGTLAGVARFQVSTPGDTRFLLGEVSQPAPLVAAMGFGIQSSAGACGVPVQLPDSVDAAGNPPAAGPLVSQFTVCGGTQSSYEIDVGGAQSFSAFVTDLGPEGGFTDLSGAVPAAYSATRPVLPLVVVPLAAGISANGIVNAASFTPGIAPGGIMAIFGQGLAGAGTATAVDVDGVASTVFSASDFQVNALVPAALAPGNHTVQVRSAYGSAQQTVVVAALAPAIFLVGNPAVGAVVNQDGTLNATTNPVARGQYVTIYATGLGAVAAQGKLSVAETTVTVVINSTELPVAFAGLAPGFAGLYQVNVQIPTGLAPGLGIPLTLKQGEILSNVVNISLQ
jgi:uncharacterized protein (TIGR03437 family)